MLKEKILNILKDKNITLYKLSKMIDFDDSALNKMIKGKIKISEELIKRLLPVLETSKEEIENWIIVDKYPKKFIEKAVNAAKNKQYKRKPVLTQNLDKILQEKNISRTVFAKAVKYDQSSVNKMINCQKALCTKVLKGASEFLEISEDEIQAWVLADKYSLKTLEQALTVE